MARQGEPMSDETRGKIVGAIILIIIFALGALGSSGSDGGSLRSKCEDRYERNKHNVIMSESRYVSNCLQTYDDLRDGSLID